MMTTEPARHDAPVLAPLRAKVMTTWPVGTFVENICALPDGDFLVSVENKDELQRVHQDGSKSVFARLPCGPAGIVRYDASFFVLGGDPGQSPGAVFKIDFDGKVDEWLGITESLFLNGFTPYQPARALAVDSIRGLVINVNLERPEYEIWCQHDLLTKISAEPMLPGVNGIKLHNGAVYVTNTDRALILRIPSRLDGSAGKPEVIAEHLRGDDVAFDRNGNLYVTTHIHNSLVRLSPDGTRVALAGIDQGMAGSTACTFGTTSGDSKSLFVTTTGGLIMPHNGVVEEAKLVRLEVGIDGYPITFL